MCHLDNTGRANAVTGVSVSTVAVPQDYSGQGEEQQQGGQHREPELAKKPLKNCGQVLLICFNILLLMFVGRLNRCVYKGIVNRGFFCRSKIRSKLSWVCYEQSVIHKNAKSCVS